jgi:hypothetical protein
MFTSSVSVTAVASIILLIAWTLLGTSCDWQLGERWRNFYLVSKMNNSLSGNKGKYTAVPQEEGDELSALGVQDTPVLQEEPVELSSLVVQNKLTC